jgi:hypothetical protein
MPNTSLSCSAEPLVHPSGYLRQRREVVVVAHEWRSRLLLLHFARDLLAFAAILGRLVSRPFTDPASLARLLLLLPLLSDLLLRSGLVDLHLNAAHVVEQRVPPPLLLLAVIFDSHLGLLAQVAFDVEEGDPIHRRVEHAAIEVEVVGDELEVEEGEWRGFVHPVPQVTADGVIVALNWALVAESDDAPDLSELLDSAIFTEELNGERGWVGSIGVLDVNGNSASELFINVLSEIVLLGGDAALVTLPIGLLRVLCWEVKPFGDLRVVGQFADRYVVGNVVLAAVSRYEDGDGLLGGHVVMWMICCGWS